MKFSCLISCYKNDNPVFLKECLASLVKQTVKADEVIFVEDGELTPELYDIISDYINDLHIKRISLPKNVGLGKALNIGLRYCSHDIVVRMDTDDIAHEERFYHQVQFMYNNENIDIVGTWAKDIDKNGKWLRDRKYPIDDIEIRRLIWANPLIHPSIAYRKSKIIKIGSYSELLRRRQDYDLWLRAAKKGLHFHNIPSFLLYYRFTDDYYKKNNRKVAFNQSLMGFNGIKGNKDVPYSAFFLVWGPWIKTLFPNFLVKKIHGLMNRIDPRSKNV